MSAIWEKILGFIQHPETFQQSLAGFAVIFVTVNTVLSTIGAVCDKLVEILATVKDKTSTKLDDQASQIASKIAGFCHVAVSWIAKVIDWLQGNRAH